MSRECPMGITIRLRETKIYWFDSRQQQEMFLSPKSSRRTSVVIQHRIQLIRYPVAYTNWAVPSQLTYQVMPGRHATSTHRIQATSFTASTDLISINGSQRLLLSVTGIKSSFWNTQKEGGLNLLLKTAVGRCLVFTLMPQKIAVWRRVEWCRSVTVGERTIVSSRVDHILNFTEDGGSRILRNVGIYIYVYTILHGVSF
jgi:hypothetical protein